jgi:hypothetical protein
LIVDATQFDLIVKRMAGWSSRRRFMGALAGVVGAKTFLAAGRVSAQTPTAFDPCGTEITDQTKITARAKYIQNQLGGDFLQSLLTSFGSTIKPNDSANATQFYELYEAVKCLLVQANDAASWSGPQVRSYLSQVKSIVAAFSVGFGGAFFSDLKQAEAPGGLRAQTGITRSQVCGAAGCTADALNAAFEAFQECNDYDKCVVDAFKAFIQSYFLGANGRPACIAEIVPACEGDCCVGVCSCGHCMPPH